MITGNNYLWTEKYRPTKFTDFYFNQNNHLIALKWLNTWHKKSKFLVLTGAPGIGKTSLAYCISRMLGYHVTEYNASDERTLNLVKTIVFSSRSLTLDNRKKLILIDEIDNISKDYMFLKELLNQKNEISCPLIFCCNEIYNTPLRLYKGILDIVKLSLNSTFVKETIEKIIIKEKILIDDCAVLSVLDMGNNDLRSIINNLQILSLRKGNIITTKKVNEFKNSNKNTFKIVEDIYKVNIKYENKYKKYYECLEAMYNGNKDNLFNIGFECYPKYCRMFRYLTQISEVNYIYDIFPEEYRFLFMDVYNDLCRSKEKIELKYQKMDIEDKSFMNIYFKDDQYINNKPLFLSKKTSFRNKKLETEIYPYIYEFMCHNNGNKNEAIVKHVKDMSVFYNKLFESLEGIFSEYLKYVKNFSALNIKFQIKREFKFKYKEGSSSSGRMYLGIDELFK